MPTDYQFKGEITSLSNNGIYTDVKVKTNNIYFTVYLTPNRFLELGLKLNEQVYIGFNQKDINIINQ